MCITLCVCAVLEVGRGCLLLAARQTSQESLDLLPCPLTVLNQAGRFWRHVYFTAFQSLCDPALVYIPLFSWFVSWPLCSTLSPATLNCWHLPRLPSSLTNASAMLFFLLGWIPCSCERLCESLPPQAASGSPCPKPWAPSMYFEAVTVDCNNLRTHPSSLFDCELCQVKAIPYSQAKKCVHN